MTQERVHRKYSPSQAERFFGCEGSTALLARVPVRPTSRYAVEGTNAHNVLEAALRNNVRDAKEAHEEHSSLFFEELDDGTNEFYLSVQIALDYIYSILDEHSDAHLYIETFVDPPLPAAPGQAGGYCDVAIYVPSTRTLFVIDYKHGAGVAKAVKGNKQARQYAAGFLYQDDALVDPDTVDAVVLVIAQPRAFHEDGIIREETLTPYAIWEYLDELNDKVAACEDPTAALTPGEDQCRFCDARTLCPARETLALQVASTSFSQITDVSSSLLPTPSTLDVERLARIRFHSTALRKWLDDVNAHCEELARGGHAVPGAKLVETQAKRKYYGEEDEVAVKLAAMLGDRNAEEAMGAYRKVMEDYPVLARLYRQSIVPITTAEKLIISEYQRRVGRGRKKKASEEAKQAFAFLTLKQSSGNLVLVDEDDPRPAVNKIQNTFSQITGLIPPS